MEHFDNSITPGASKAHWVYSILLTAGAIASYHINDILCTIATLVTIGFTIDRWRYHRKTRNKN